MVRTLTLLFPVLVACVGCSSYGSPVHFVVPIGFKGPIRLVLDESNGIEVTTTNGKLFYRIPSTGTLSVTSFKPFEPLSVRTTAYEDGTPIPQEYETWTGPNGEKPTLGKDSVVFQSRGFSQRNDDPPVMTFFVGSIVEFEEWPRQQPPFLSDAETESR